MEEKLVNHSRYTTEALTGSQHIEIQIFTEIGLLTDDFFEGFPTHTQYKNKKIILSSINVIKGSN